MLVERRAQAQERRVVPETIARFLSEAAGHASMELKPVKALPHTFDPSRTASILQQFQRDPDWKLPAVANRYPRLSTDRTVAEEHHLEWVTPGHPLFESVRRHVLHVAQEPFKRGACFYSLQHDSPARIDFYRARVVDGLGNVVHERMLAVELDSDGAMRLREPTALGDFTSAPAPHDLPGVVSLPEATSWLHENGLQPFLDEVRRERLAEVDRVAEHVDLSLTELLQKADDEIGRGAAEVDQGVQGAEGRVAQAEARHAELLARRDRRRRDLEQQRSLTLQAVERITSVLVLPHPAREEPEVRRLRPNLETEAVAMRVVMEHERAQGRQVYDVHEQDLGYDITSLDIRSGQLRLIEVKGIGGPSGTVLLTPNERRVAEDRRDCYWLYVVTNCSVEPRLQDPIADPARFPWNEVRQVAHYYLTVNALTQPMQVREPTTPYGRKE
jgi:hypothetical protein